jgi:hypothetical protein
MVIIVYEMFKIHYFNCGSLCLYYLKSEEDISNVVVQVVFYDYNKLLWFVSELPEKDISNVVVQCR